MATIQIEAKFRKILFGLVMGLFGFFPPPQAFGEGEISFSMTDQKLLRIAPEFSFGRSTYNYGGCTCHPGEEFATDLEFGIRLMAGSNQAKTILIGFDLRQKLARADNRDGIDIFGTKLGLRLEGAPRWLSQANFALSWYFGDTLVVRHHDEQFNGNTLTLSMAYQLGVSLWGVEVGGANYHEGPGFIALSRRPGDETLAIRSVSFHVSVPYDISEPNWFRWSQGAASEN